MAQNDTILLITFSGRTLELQALLRHIRPSLPLLVLTSHMDPATCPLFNNRPPANCILLPAPIHTSETLSFGLPAPMTSTTVALALGDAIALAVANHLHPSPQAVFEAHHPGGAIGASASAKKYKTMGDIAIPISSVPIARPRSLAPVAATEDSPVFAVTALDVLLAAARSPSGWVLLSPFIIAAPRRIQDLGPHLDRSFNTLEDGFFVEKADWISVPASNTVAETRAWIEEMRRGKRGRTFLRRGTLLGIVDGMGDVSGVVEIEDVVDIQDDL